MLATGDDGSSCDKPSSPVAEVKSGRKIRSHAALDRLMEVEQYKIRNAIVLSRNPLSREGRVLYAPIYMTFCLDELVEREGSGFTFTPSVGL